MTNWLPSLEGRSGPRYLAIADALASDVADGSLKPGERLPTHRDLGWKLGVTVGTVSRAYAEAERRGLVSGEVGRGTFVRNLEARDRHTVMTSSLSAPGTINLNFAFPPPAEDTRAIETTLEALAKDPIVSLLLDYNPHAGLERHRAAAATWLARSGMEVEPGRIVLTAGAQHAISVCLAATTRPGDRILSDSLTYSGMQVAARLLGLRLEGLPGDEQGLLPDAVETACRSNDVKALYCMPTMHNPTTVTMPDERRRAIAHVARKYDVAIIEDDIFGLLVDSPKTPISAYAPEQGFFLTSLSKTVAPGLRVGFAAGPARASERLAAAVRASCWMATPLTAEIATRWIEDGTADRILAGRKREAAARREIALGVLGKWQPLCPPGSIYLWLSLPESWRAPDFALEAQRREVAVTPADACAVGRRDVPSAIRICLGAPKSREHLRRGLETLARLLDDGPSPSFGSII